MTLALQHDMRIAPLSISYDLPTFRPPSPLPTYILRPHMHLHYVSTISQPLTTEPFAFIRGCVLEFKRAYRLWVGPWSLLVLVHPETIKVRAGGRSGGRWAGLHVTTGTVSPNHLPTLRLSPLCPSLLLYCGHFLPAISFVGRPVARYTKGLELPLL